MIISNSQQSSISTASENKGDWRMRNHSSMDFLTLMQKRSGCFSMEIWGRLPLFMDPLPYPWTTKEAIVEREKRNHSSNALRAPMGIPVMLETFADLRSYSRNCSKESLFLLLSYTHHRLRRLLLPVILSMCPFESFRLIRGKGLKGRRARHSQDHKTCKIVYTPTRTGPGEYVIFARKWAQPRQVIWKFSLHSTSHRLKSFVTPLSTREDGMHFFSWNLRMWFGSLIRRKEK